MNSQEKVEKVKDFRPIDDVFFEVLAQNPVVCQEILQVIMEDDKLVVNNVIIQCSEQNFYGRSVRLDALCTLGNGVKCNIEVQRSNNDDHLKRARFNASSITVKESNPGDNFKDIIELYIVYISEFDFFKGRKTIYHVDKILRETGTEVDDGLHEIFVNTVIDDGTDIAELMACFMKKEVKNPKFPALSAEVSRLKETEGGARAVCEVMEKYEKIAVKNANVKKIIRMLEKNYSKEEIIDIGYTEEEILEAENQLMQLV
ncbi:MAG: PD-(D/E)XK nuclease family transposase [Lachnospiraceae bacterium]|nr:PD-(D/E)XK nuclease family transposase [Lachnospiraceae bacterium]